MDIKVDSNTVVCFDLDDTLYNEIEYLKSAYKEIAKKLAKDNWKTLYAKMFSLYRKKENVFVFLINEYPTCTKDELLNVYRNHVPIITLFPDVLALFEAIRQHKGKLAIITDGRSVTQRNKLKSLGIMAYFDTLVISEEIGTEKPHQANFAAVENDFQNKSYYYIGDNFKKDFIMPNKRGWTSIALLDNGLNIHNNTYEFLGMEQTPHYLITSYAELNVI